MKIFGSMKRQKAFENFIMNCRMIVLIKLYNSKILLKQKTETDDEESSITTVASWL